MGFLDFLKKLATQNKPDDQNTKNNSVKVEMTFKETVDGKTSKLSAADTKRDNISKTDMDHLTADGELPWGWIYHNKEFTGKINDEYSHFLNCWVNSRSGLPKEQYSALKSFVVYLEDLEKLCKSKGECFEWWFYNVLASKEYIENRKKDLDEIITKFDTLEKNHEAKCEKEEKIATMKPAVIVLLKENDGILQSDFWKLFDDEICCEAAKEIVYDLLRNGKIERTKSGRSYLLHYKG